MKDLELIVLKFTCLFAFVLLTTGLGRAQWVQMNEQEEEMNRVPAANDTTLIAGTSGADWWRPLSEVTADIHSCSIASVSMMPPRAPVSRAGKVVGTVVKGKHPFPLPDQLVAIDDRQTITDGEGRFTFEDVPARYDVVIVNPDKSRIRIYKDLTRRDPVLVLPSPQPARSHTAEITGKLQGGGPYPLQSSMSVRFSSRYAAASFRIGGRDGRTSPGPGFGPITVTWDGPECITGYVMALNLGIPDRAADDPKPSWVARQAVTLADGQSIAIDLAMVKVPNIIRPSAVIKMDGDYPLSPYRAHYRTQASGYTFHGDVARKSIGPDLSDWGLTHCTEAYEWNPYIRSRYRLCGKPADKPVVLNLRSGPKFSAPKWNTPAAVGLNFVWSAVPGGIYRLRLAPVKKVGAARPRIEIMTSGTRASWPDLSDVGVTFPKPLASYAATVAVYGPFETMDDAVGPDGLAATVPAELWSAESNDLSIPVQYPMRPEVAACQYSYASMILCDSGPPGTPSLGERYMLSAINNIIRYYPEFADAIGIYCVRDCETARAFMKAYGKYSKTHPGFNKDQPLEPLPPPRSPLPPEMKRR